MKKVITFLLVVVLCLTPCLLLVGCDKDETYWKTTHEKIEAFTNDTQYEFINNELDLTSTYNQALIFALKPFNTYKNSLQVKPFYLTEKNNKQIKKYFEDFNEKFNNFTNECNNFISAKQTFNSLVYENLQQDFCLQKLKDYKRSYANLITCSLEISESILSLYNNCYLSYEKQNQTVAENAPLLFNYEFMLKMTKLYVSTEILEFDKLSKVNEYSTNIKALVIALSNNLTKQLSSEILSAYDYCLENYNIFNNEIKMYTDCLDKLSLDKLLALGTDTYLNENPDLIPYYNSFTNLNNLILPHIELKISAMFN